MLLDISTGILIATLTVFVIVLLAMSKFWPKMVKLIEDREETIRSSLANAEKAKEEAEKIQVQYQEMIAKAKQESGEIIKNGTVQAEKVKDELIANAKEESKQIVENTRKEMELEREKAVQELKAKIVDISIVIATKVIKSSMTDEKQAELAREALKEMEMN